MGSAPEGPHWVSWLIMLAIFGGFIALDLWSVLTSR